MNTARIQELRKDLDDFRSRQRLEQTGRSVQDLVAGTTSGAVKEYRAVRRVGSRTTLDAVPAEADVESRGDAAVAGALYSKVLDAAVWVGEVDPAVEDGDDAVW